MRTQTIAAVVPLIIVFGFSGEVWGQGGSGIVPPSSAPIIRTRRDVIIKKETVYVPKPVPPTKGQLFVATEHGANIVLEPLDKGNKISPEASVPADRRDWVFNDLPPGDYRVVVNKPGYVSREMTVTIKKGETEHKTLDLEVMHYSVTIHTNVDAGTLRFGKNGETPRSMEFQDRNIKLELPAGDYAAEITHAGITASQKFSVKADNIVVELPLNIVSTETLSPTWTTAELKRWELPSTWGPNPNQSLLLVKGRGVAIPRDARNRYYQDFRLESNVKMTNGVAASFALRAKDSQNYYLVQLTGGNSDEPYMVRLFAVKNGAEERLRAIPVAKSKAAPLASGQFFNLSITMKGYEIAVDIADSQTGELYHLGVLTDPDHNFPVGAVGVAARDNEENVVERFVVCTGKCLEG